MNLKRALPMSGACGVLATAVSTALAQHTREVAEVVIVTGSVDTNLIPTAAIRRQGTTAPSSILMDGGVLLSGTAFRRELSGRAALADAADRVNLTDEEPPFVRLELAYDPFTASALGRIFKLGLTKRVAAE